MGRFEKRGELLRNGRKMGVDNGRGYGLEEEGCQFERKGESF